ncbi:MAG: hypothetical protein IC227_01610 [Enterococcus lacertideformus]|uniref:Uncharacterized protein n=1 Tax=Enterococcus lacertideformus TaxID=2771493 RepID=A0A931AUJ5_9ENTE|nr:hypothetical protein [Enterococcus lacertideformus]
MQKNLTPELANCVKPLLEHENKRVNKVINMLNTLFSLEKVDTIKFPIKIEHNAPEKSVEKMPVEAVNLVINQMDKVKNNETQKNSPSEQSLLKEKIHEVRRGSNESNRSKSSTSLKRKIQQVEK